jgi:hypothetical protein
MQITSMRLILYVPAVIVEAVWFRVIDVHPVIVLNWRKGTILTIVVHVHVTIPRVILILVP